MKKTMQDYNCFASSFLILQFAVSVALDSECHRASATLVCHAFVFDFFKSDGTANCGRRPIGDVFQKAFQRCFLLAKLDGHL